MEIEELESAHMLRDVIVILILIVIICLLKLAEDFMK